MTIAYVGVGSNVGSRTDFCRMALEELARDPSIEVTRTSSLYETSPLGGPPQRSYVNMVAKLETSLDARGLLERCKQIESSIGREPSEIRWGPRVIDLDILLFGDLKLNEPDLEIPHPRIAERRFVLVPLVEIDPEVTDPWGKRYADWLAQAEGSVEYLEDL